MARKKARSKCPPVVLPKPKAYHAWACMVRNDGCPVAVFTNARKDAVAAMRAAFWDCDFSERKCQKVTITEGWQGKRRPNMPKEKRA